MENIKYISGDKYTTETLTLECERGSASLLIGLNSPELQIDGIDDPVYQFEKTDMGLIGVGPMYKNSPEIYNDSGELLVGYIWLKNLLIAADECVIRKNTSK